MTEIIIIVIVIVISFGVWFFADRVVTIKRLEKNQKEWDEFSKDMTDREKFDEYLSFCNSQKAKYGWGYYYLPKMKLKGEIDGWK